MTRPGRLKMAAAAAGLFVGGVFIAGPANAVSGLVTNHYICSNQTNQCWQQNPPHDPTIINTCVWTSPPVYNAAPAATTCNKYTPR